MKYCPTKKGLYRVSNERILLQALFQKQTRVWEGGICREYHGIFSTMPQLISQCSPLISQPKVFMVADVSSRKVERHCLPAGPSLKHTSKQGSFHRWLGKLLSITLITTSVSLWTRDKQCIPGDGFCSTEVHGLPLASFGKRRCQGTQKSDADSMSRGSLLRNGTRLVQPTAWNNNCTQPLSHH